MAWALIYRVYWFFVAIVEAGRNKPTKAVSPATATVAGESLRCTAPHLKDFVRSDSGLFSTIPLLLRVLPQFGLSPAAPSRCSGVAYSSDMVWSRKASKNRTNRRRTERKLNPNFHQD